MGKHDAAAYEYLSQPKYFADLFNAKFFGGRQVIDGTKLMEADSRTPVDGEPTQYRNIKKRLPNGSHFVILAIENQDNVDYEMPWRIMGYDHAEYTRQIRELHRQKEEAGAQSGKKLSWQDIKMGPEDKISPVCTICFYHGKEPWKGPRSLKDMMDCGDFPEAFSDYRMYLVCADDAEIAGKCNTQLGLLLRVLAARGSRKQMEQLKNSGEFDYIDAETSRAIAKLADMPKLLEHVEKEKQSGQEEPEGGYSMCIAIDEMVNEGEKRGEKRGADKVNRLYALLLEHNRLEDLRRAVGDAAF